MHALINGADDERVGSSTAAARLRCTLVSALQRAATWRGLALSSPARAVNEGDGVVGDGDERDGGNAGDGGG